jgi:hypothetical protein
VRVDSLDFQQRYHKTIARGSSHKISCSPSGFSISLAAVGNFDLGKEIVMTFRVLWLALVGACLFTCRMSSAQETNTPSKYALLIGIDEYQHPAEDIQLPDASVPRIGRDEPALTYADLEGPANDVKSMQEVLITKFHFPGDPVIYFRVTESRGAGRPGERA